VSVDYDTFYIVVNALVIREDLLLLGRRKDVIGDGTWALPGGHLESGEHIIAAGRRELAEETGLAATVFKFVGLVNTPRLGSRGHYLQIGLLAKDATGEAALQEPDKCAEWRWFALAELPDDLFVGHDALIELFRSQAYFRDSR
jgi:8-oxo-dGTP diphosphatase